jgi:hypothetical protein
MTTETTITVTDAVRAALIEAGAECRAADAADTAFQDALARARAHFEECEQQVARRTAERASWIERAAKKADAEICAGRTPQSAPAADTKSQLDHAGAVANLEKAQRVVAWREAAAAETRQRREAAHARLQAIMTAEDTRHVDELLQQIAARRAEIDELRALAGAPLYGREMAGLREFDGIVARHQVDALNSPGEPPLNIEALFARRRFVVGVHQSLAAATGPLDDALGHWRRRRQALEAIAFGEAAPEQEAAA